MVRRIKKSDYFFGGILIVASILIFAIPFGLSPITFADSPAYMTGHLTEGIVPLYPLFICLNKLIFPQDYYLRAVVLEQITFAAFCTVFFVLYIKREMDSKWIETYMFFMFSLAPYTAFMPAGMTSRFIATEALAYPCFYLLILFILKGMWTNKALYILIADIAAILMALTRTQLQVVMLIPVGAFFLLWIRGFVRNEKMRRSGRFISGILLSCLIFILSYGVYRQSNMFLQKALSWTTKAVESKIDNQDNLESAATADINEENYPEEAEDEVRNGPAGSADVSSNNNNIVSQFSTVIFMKVMIMADKSDADLFPDADMRQAYIYIYDRLEQEQRILSSMDKNLLIGDPIRDSLASMPKLVDMYLHDFIAEHPDSGISLGAAKTEFASILFRAHPFRWMVSGIIQFPSGLISTVFVHKRSMYWISHLATAVVYALALGMCIARRKYLKQRDLMVVGICVNVLFVIATSMVFVSIKRYVNYGFGVFYISLYCIVKDFMVDFIKNHYGKTGVTS